MIALRVGEPFGTLILALAVTIIELALIGSMMLSGSTAASTLARDTVFATVMIVCNGVVGLCLLMGAIRQSRARVPGRGNRPGVVGARRADHPHADTAQAHHHHAGTDLFSRTARFRRRDVSLLLYGVFVFVQTVRHRDYFLPIDTGAEVEHAARPSALVAWASLALLLVALVAVVGLAKALAPNIETGVEAVAAPAAVVGIVIALLVLLPETWAALRAATRNRMQTSLNLALGSALATIGLTIPTLAALSILFDLPLELGLAPKDTALLALTLLISAVTLASGRSTVLQGAVHLVLFGAFLFLAFVP